MGSRSRPGVLEGRRAAKRALLKRFMPRPPPPSYERLVLVDSGLPRECSCRWPWSRSLVRPPPVELRSRRLHAVRETRRRVVPLVVRVLRPVACKPLNTRNGAQMAGPVCAAPRSQLRMERPVQRQFHHSRRFGGSRRTCSSSIWPEWSCRSTSCELSDFDSNSCAHVTECMCDRRRVGSVFPRRF